MGLTYLYTGNQYLRCRYFKSHTFFMKNNNDDLLLDPIFFKIITEAENFIGISITNLHFYFRSYRIFITSNANTNENFLDLWTESGAVSCVLNNNICQKIFFYPRNDQMADQISNQCDISLQKISLNKWRDKTNNIKVIKYGVDSRLIYYSII